MRNMIIAVVVFIMTSSAARAQSLTHVSLKDTLARPENITSSKDGTVYFGSMEKGTIFRAAPGAAQAEPWILGSTSGLTRTLGVLAHDASNTLWVCQNATGGRNGAPLVGQTTLRSFDLRTGAAKGTYSFPADPGVCNDIAVASNGMVYASESFRGRIHRLKPGAKDLEVWASSEDLAVIDGIALLGDGSLYANNFATGKLFRIPVNADGTAGTPVPIETSIPFVRPDGLRTAGPQKLIQAEQQGRVTELTINGNRADVRVIKDGLTRPAGVTLLRGAALVLVDFKSAVSVPYQP